MKNIIRVFSLLLTGILLFVGFVFLLLSIGQYEALHGFLNQLAPDGTLESFTAEFHAQVRIPLLFFGGILFILGGLSVNARSHYKQMMEETFYWIPSFITAVLEDAKVFLKLLIPEKLVWWEWALLILIILVAVAGRWVLIEQPMQPGESYSFITFARQDFRDVISDYHLPNNHIFNSVLIHFLYKIFGNSSPIVVRFPAFLAGILLCVSGYFFTRREYGKWPAIVVGMLFAVFPALKVQSVNGLGYMLMALFTFWMMALAFIARRSRNRFVWVLLIFVSALNFWTLPFAIYPFFIIGFWLLLSAVVGDIDDAYEGMRNFLKYFIGVAVSVGVIVFLLYTPVFLIGSGWNSVVNRSSVASLTGNDFIRALPLCLVDIFQQWTSDVPLIITICLAVGGILCLIFRHKVVKFRISLPIVTLVVLIVIFFVRKPNPCFLAWDYLLPLILIWCVMGWFALIKLLMVSKNIQKGSTILGIVLLTIFLVWGVYHLHQNLNDYHAGKNPEETITLWLKEEFNLTEEDIVLTSSDSEPVYWYYFDLYGIPLSTVIELQDRVNWDLIYLIVDDRENDSYLELFAQQPIAPEVCPFDVVEPVYEYGYYTVYQCNALKP